MAFRLIHRYRGLAVLVRSYRSVFVARQRQAKTPPHAHRGGCHWPPHNHGLHHPTAAR